MTITNEELLWENRWPGRLRGGKVHIFSVIVDPFQLDPLQWYEKDLPERLRGRAGALCGFGKGGLVGLRVFPLEDWGLVDCKRCFALLRRHIERQLAQ